MWATITPASLRCNLHYHDLDLLIPEALHAVSADGRLDADRTRNSRHFCSRCRRETIDLPVMSMVNNYDGKNGWCPPEMLADAGQSGGARASCRNQLEEYADAEHQPGIVVDFESLPQIEPEGFPGLHPRSGDRDLHAAKPEADGRACPRRIGATTTSILPRRPTPIILMNYDFHWPDFRAGPIAPQDWFERNIDNMVKLVPPDKIVMGIANYGYDWPAKTKASPASGGAGRDFPAGSGHGG